MDYRSAVTVNHSLIDSQRFQTLQECHQSQVLSFECISPSHILGHAADRQTVRIADSVPDTTVVQKARAIEIGFATHASAPPSPRTLIAEKASCFGESLGSFSTTEQVTNQARIWL
jgi:hypothetical protein